MPIYRIRENFISYGMNFQRGTITRVYIQDQSEMPMNLLFCLLFDILFVQTSIFKGRPFLKNFTNSNLDLKLSIEWTFLNQYYQRINYKCSKKSQSPFIQSKIVSILTLKIETLRFFLIRVKINFKVIINFEVTNLDPSNKNYFIIDETKAKKKKKPMHRSAIIIFHKYLQLDTVANYGGLYRKFNNKREHSSRCVHARSRAYCTRYAHRGIVRGTWTLSMADRSREPWMGQPSRFILPPPPHLIYSRASVSPSTVEFRR